jgi:hypothetical protein
LFQTKLSQTTDVLVVLYGADVGYGDSFSSTLKMQDWAFLLISATSGVNKQINEVLVSLRSVVPFYANRRFVTLSFIAFRNEH